MTSGASRGGRAVLSVELQPPWPQVLEAEFFCTARQRGQARGRRGVAASLSPQLTQRRERSRHLERASIWEGCWLHMRVGLRGVTACSRAWGAHACTRCRRVVQRGRPGDAPPFCHPRTLLEPCVARGLAVMYVARGLAVARCWRCRFQDAPAAWHAHKLLELHDTTSELPVARGKTGCAQKLLRLGCLVKMSASK